MVIEFIGFPGNKPKKPGLFGGMRKPLSSQTRQKISQSLKQKRSVGVKKLNKAGVGLQKAGAKMQAKAVVSSAKPAVGYGVGRTKIAVAKAPKSKTNLTNKQRVKLGAQGAKQTARNLVPLAKNRAQLAVGQGLYKTGSTLSRLRVKK